MIAAAHRLRQVARRWRAVAAGLCLLGVGVTVAQVGLTQSPPASAEILWHADDGTAFRMSVPRDAAERFAAERRMVAEQAVAALDARLRASAEDEAAAVARRMMAGLPDFADWLYGWVDSYVASYMIAVRAAQSVGEAVRGGEPVRPVASLEAAMHAVVGEQFRRRVVDPAAPGPAMTAAAERLDSILDRELRRLGAIERAAWDAFVRREGTVLGRADAPPAACDGATVAASSESRLSALQLDQDNLVALRFLRPYAARGALVGLRAGFGDALGLPGGSGLSVAALAAPGALLTLAATTAVVWSLDWLINRADAALNRAELEAVLATAIESAWRAEAAAQAARLQQRLAGHAACLRPPLA